MRVFKLGIVSCKFIYNDIIILYRHPELGSGSKKLILKILNQVQNDVQKVKPVINIRVVRLSGVKAFRYEN